MCALGKAAAKIHQDSLKVQESKYNGLVEGSCRVYMTKEEIQSIHDTLPYITMHMHEILNEAFVNMFTLNPDIKDKFFSLKDVTIEELKNMDPSKFILYLLALKLPRFSSCLYGEGKIAVI